jgi:hypothetical protein
VEVFIGFLYSNQSGRRRKGVMRINSNAYYSFTNSRTVNNPAKPFATDPPVQKTPLLDITHYYDPKVDNGTTNNTWSSVLNLFNSIFKGLTGQESLQKPIFTNSIQHAQGEKDSQTSAGTSYTLPVTPLSSLKSGEAGAV